MDTSSFLSKNNTISLYTKLTEEESQIFDLDKSRKQEIVNILIDNMKVVYKSIDLSKVSKKNYKSIMKQFNKLSVKETLNKLRSDNIIKKRVTFNENIQINHNKNNNINTQNNSHTQNNINNISKNFEKQGKTLDNYFQTFQPSNEGKNKFVFAKKDINSKMEEMIENRNAERPNQILEIPEFLQPQSTKRKREFVNNTSLIKNDDQSFGFSGDINADDYTSINDMNTELVSNKKNFNDSISISERLRLMQEERDSGVNNNNSNDNNSQTMRNNITKDDKMNSCRNVYFR